MKKNLLYIFSLSTLSIIISWIYSKTLSPNYLLISIFTGILAIGNIFINHKKVIGNNLEQYGPLLLLPYVILFPDKYIIILFVIIISLILNKSQKSIVKDVVSIFLAGISLYITPGSILINSSFILFAGFAYGVARVRIKTKKIVELPSSLLVLSGFSIIFAIVREIALNTTIKSDTLIVERWFLVIILILTLILLFSRFVQILLPKLSIIFTLFTIIGVAIVIPGQSFSKTLLNNINSSGSKLGISISQSNNGAMTSEEGAGPRPQFNNVSFEYCDEINSRDCFITYYDELANKKGMNFALDDLVDKVRNNKGKTFASHCHQTIHNLGQLAFELTDGDFQLVSSYDPQVCGTGFIHGLYERYFNNYGKYLFSMTGEICEKMNLLQNWYAWTCNHILGHTIMTKMMNNPNYAVEYCNQLLNVSVHHRDCQAGAWMNFFADDTIINWFRDNAMNKPELLFNICYGAETNSKYWCYQEIFPILLTISDNNVEKMASWCKEYSEKPRGNGPIYSESALFFEERCIGGMARVLGVANGYDYRVIMSRCSSIADQRQVDTCLTAGAASIVLNTGSVSGGIELCERVEDKGYREYCFVWVKQTNVLLASGPNSDNMPKFGEIRTTENDYLFDLPEKKTKI